MFFILLTTVAVQNVSPPPPFVAMVLRVQGRVECRSARGDVRPAEALDVLYPGDLLTTGSNADAIVVFCSDGRRERVRPQRQATIGALGCSPPTAVESLAVAGKEREAVQEAMTALSTSTRGAVSVLRDPPRSAARPCALPTARAC